MSASSERFARAQVRIAQACATVERDIAANHRIRDLAQAAGMAPHHFQRRFAAMTGETVAGYLRSRRLERAAILLRQSDSRIIDIALDCGFETHAALTRAFKAHFGIGPAVLRREGLDAQMQGAQPRPFLKPVESNSLDVACDVIDMPAQWLCWRRATGMVDGRYFPDMDTTQAAFAALEDELGDLAATFASGYPQGPSGFDDQGAVAYFGALMDEKRKLDWAEGWTPIEAGSYAVFGHHGPLTTLHLTWHRAARVGLGRLGLALRPGWMVETYLTSLADPVEGRLSALIHLPVEKKHDRESAASPR